MDKKIKSVNTSGLKKWIQENIKDEHLTTSEKEIIMLINSLPEEYTKSEVEKDLIQLYGCLMFCLISICVGIVFRIAEIYSMKLTHEKDE